MNDFLKSLIPDFTKKALYDISKKIFLVLVPLLLIGGGVIFWRLKDIDKITLIIGFIIGVALSSMIWAFIYIFIFFKYGDDDIIIDPNYRVLEAEVTYKHLTRTNIIYTRRLKLSILRDGVDRYIGKYNWTGHGKEIISVKDKTQELIKTRRKEIWQIYEVKFPKVLSKNDIVELEVLMELEDTDNKAVPIFTHTVAEPTNQVMIKVGFPNDVKTENKVLKSEFANYSAKVSLNSYSEEIKYNEVSWLINDPKLFHRYVIQWNWVE